MTRSRVVMARAWGEAGRGGPATLGRLAGVRDDPACVWLEIGGVRCGMLSRETAAGLGLREGMAWTAALHGAVDSEVRRRLCDRAAVRLLTTRARSRAELERALVQRGHDRVTAEACVAAWDERGAIDDERYAETVVRGTLARRPVGRAVLEATLRGRGVEGRVARAAVDTALEGRDEIADARKAGVSAWRSLASLEAAVGRRRLSARLARRGFSAGVVRRVVDEIAGGAR